ncbi:endonuclease domain-containing protein [Streptomyces sparsogenes]|uniref:endonuclease domain-containing protein n=1 Tax=Streptomyces sparsogenes TaxID=67365 RepID=UPI0033D36EB4
MANHQKPKGRPCAHKTYRVSCDEYDRLLEEAGGRCQICRVHPGETKQGFLVVDHDASVGCWAVRGLLCTACNTGITVSPSYSKEFNSYMANPWWRRMLEEQGLSGEMHPEPPLGAVVIVLPNRRRWRRESDRWQQLANYGGYDLTWKELNRRFGPHRILLPS